MIKIENNEYTTFKCITYKGVMRVTFDYPPINVLGIPMMKDLSNLTNYLNNNKDIKVVVFDSSNPLFFISHADIDMLKHLSTKPISKEEVRVNDLAKVLDGINKLPQVTIALIDGYARGGGHEFALACDLRYATKDAIFMQMEVGMGILPCGGGSSRLARQVGLGKALEIILSAKDFNGEEAYKLGTINKCIEKDKINLYVSDLAHRIAKFPLEAIKACKKTIYNSLDTSLENSLKEETYQLYEATSKTGAVKRFKYASSIDFQNNIDNQKNFQTLLLTLQDIN